MGMKPELHGYRVWITCPIYCNGKFTHNSRRFEIVHAPRMTIDLARQMISLESEKESGDSQTKIRAGAERIESVVYLGRVKYVVKVEYVTGDDSDAN
jgi:hypothetical protein